jgi:hypothetical protein
LDGGERFLSGENSRPRFWWPMGERLLSRRGDLAYLESRAGGSTPRWYLPSRLSSSR